MSGLTGGQYSVYRVLLGSYLAIHFAMLIPYGPEVFGAAGVLPDAALSPLNRVFPNVLSWFDSGFAVQALLGFGVLCSVALALGTKDRLAAVLLWYLWACLFARNPLIGNPSLPYVGLLLVVHALLPSSPYGSWSARGRTDPRGDWHMDPGLLRVLWILMAVGYSYSGLTKLSSPSWLNGTAISRVLENPLARPGFVRDSLLALPGGVLSALTYGALALEIAFAPLALFRLTRPWAWFALLGMHLGLMLVIDFADLSFGMVLLHIATFNPAWIRATVPPKAPSTVPSTGNTEGAATTEVVFYDGECGLCHRAIRFLLAEDEKATFQLAPLQGETMQAATQGMDKPNFPDSILVKTASGHWLSKSSAVLHIGRHLGGLWRIAAQAAWFLPRPLRDWTYDRIAQIRKRLFDQPKDLCPMTPPDLGKRFLP